MDTNAIPDLATRHLTPGTLNAWHLVALGVGAFITGAYHTVVNGGGLKRIASNFWNGKKEEVKRS